MIRRLIVAASLALALPVLAHEYQAGDLAIGHGWSRAMAAGANGGGFLTITNRGQAPDRLLGASSPAARGIELHSMVRDGDVMRMREARTIEIPPGQTVTLQPGGLHLMLLGLTSPIERGGVVPVTLRFERAGEVRVELAVQAAGARAPAGDAAHAPGRPAHAH